MIDPSEIEDIVMFPTHVGMNRIKKGEMVEFTHVPHTRGDEPPYVDRENVRIGMFPTHVGMNRLRPGRPRLRRHVPHTRGDEPGNGFDSTGRRTCSPHTWG